MTRTTILEFENTRVTKVKSGKDIFGCPTYTLTIDGIAYTDVSNSAEWRKYWLVQKTGKNTYSVKMVSDNKKDLTDFLPVIYPNHEVIENLAQFVDVKFNYTTKERIVARKCDYYTEEKKARIKEYNAKRNELNKLLTSETVTEFIQRLAELDKEYEDCVFGTK